MIRRLASSETFAGSLSLCWVLGLMDCNNSQKTPKCLINEIMSITDIAATDCHLPADVRLFGALCLFFILLF